MTLYCYHNWLTGNDSFYDANNVEGLEIKFKTHFTEDKGKLSTI